jgi:hypothetical protein
MEADLFSEPTSGEVQCNYARLTSQYFTFPSRVLFAVDRATIVRIADVNDGTYDLRVPRMIAQVLSVSSSSAGDWKVELQVPRLLVLTA